MYSADYTEKSVSCLSETRRPQCVGLIDPSATSPASTLPFTSIYPSPPTYSPHHGPMYSADYTEKSVSCLSETRRPQCVGLIDPGMRRDCPKEVLPERLDLRPSNLKT